MSVYRLMLKEVEVKRLDNGECRIVVSLACKENIYIGEVVSADIEEKRLKAVAQATLQSIIKLLPQSVKIRLDQSGQVSFASKNMFFVVVEFIEDLNLQFLFGTFLFTTTNLDIAAQAILHAINRKMEKYLPK